MKMKISATSIVPAIYSIKIMSCLTIIVPGQVLVDYFQTKILVVVQLEDKELTGQILFLKQIMVSKLILVHPINKDKT